MVPSQEAAKTSLSQWFPVATPGMVESKSQIRRRMAPAVPPDVASSIGDPWNIRNSGYQWKISGWWWYQWNIIEKIIGMAMIQWMDQLVDGRNLRLPCLVQENQWENHWEMTWGISGWISMDNPLLADHWDDSLWFLATLLATLHFEKTHHFFNS